MGYFDDIVDDTLLERELVVRGKYKTTYWQPLTAGQKIELLRGQKITVGAGSGSQVIELSESAERNHKLVQMTLVTAERKPVYPNLKALHAEPDYLVEALAVLASEVHKEGDAGNA